MQCLMLLLGEDKAGEGRGVPVWFLSKHWPPVFVILIHVSTPACIIVKPKDNSGLLRLQS